MPGESANDFLVELRRLARTCDFNQFLEEALRDRLVCGLANKSTQKKLLSEKTLLWKEHLKLLSQPKWQY